MKEPKVLVKELGLEWIDYETAILEIVRKVVKGNPESVVDYKAGRDRAIGFLAGQLWKPQGSRKINR